MNQTITTASTLKAVLCYIDPDLTPKIAYDNDKYAQPLIDKVKKALGDKDGSQDVYISFSGDEQELQRQFSGVCGNIKSTFDFVQRCTS